MEQEANNNIFDIRLNQECLKEILKFARLAKWVFVLVIIVFIISLAGAIGDYIIASGTTHASKSTELYYRIYPVFIIIYFVLALIQAFCYLKSGNSLTTSIRNNDETLFNHSFVFLCKNAFFGLLTLLLAIAINGFRLIILLKYFHNH